MALATQLQMTRDAQGMVVREGMGLQFSNNNVYFTLTASDVTTVTVPNSNALAYLAIFTYSEGADVWVLPASTPTLTLPTGTVTTTLAQLNPDRRIVIPGQVLQFLYVNTQVANQVVSVGISYYANSANNFFGGPR